MSEGFKHKRRSFSDEFKRDPVNLVVNQEYSFRAAAEAVGVGAEFAQKEVHRNGREPEVGRRHHLHANGRGLGVPRRRPRPV